MSDLDEMIRRAREVRENAYAPYSGYKVGACVQDAEGRLWVGANFENVSFGATICAERAAVGAMVAGGGSEVKACVVVTKDGGAPCGMCLQVLSEFIHNGEMVVFTLVAEAKVVATIRFSALVPVRFATEEDLRTV